MMTPKDYRGPFLYGGPYLLACFRAAGYPEYMLRESKPIPLATAPDTPTHTLKLNKDTGCYEID